MAPFHSHHRRRAACWNRQRRLRVGLRTTRTPVSERAAQSAKHPRFARQRFRN
jgi:hypothetical protein